MSENSINELNNDKIIGNVKKIPIKAKHISFFSHGFITNRLAYAILLDIIPKKLPNNIHILAFIPFSILKDESFSIKYFKGFEPNLSYNEFLKETPILYLIFSFEKAWILAIINIKDSEVFLLNWLEMKVDFIVSLIDGLIFKEFEFKPKKYSLLKINTYDDFEFVDNIFPFFLLKNSVEIGFFSKNPLENLNVLGKNFNYFKEKTFYKFKNLDPNISFDEKTPYLSSKKYPKIFEYTKKESLHKFETKIFYYKTKNDKLAQNFDYQPKKNSTQKVSDLTLELDREGEESFSKDNSLEIVRDLETKKSKVHSSETSSSFSYESLENEKISYPNTFERFENQKIFYPNSFKNKEIFYPNSLKSFENQKFYPNSFESFKNKKIVPNSFERFENQKFFSPNSFESFKNKKIVYPNSFENQKIFYPNSFESFKNKKIVYPNSFESFENQKNAYPKKLEQPSLDIIEKEKEKPANSLNFEEFIDNLAEQIVEGKKKENNEKLALTKKELRNMIIRHGKGVKASLEKERNERDKIEHIHKQEQIKVLKNALQVNKTLWYFYIYFPEQYPLILAKYQQQLNNKLGIDPYIASNLQNFFVKSFLENKTPADSKNNGSKRSFSQKLPPLQRYKPEFNQFIEDKSNIHEDNSSKFNNDTRGHRVSKNSRISEKSLPNYNRSFISSKHNISQDTDNENKKKSKKVKITSPQKNNNSNISISLKNDDSNNKSVSFSQKKLKVAERYGIIILKEDIKTASIKGLLSFNLMDFMSYYYQEKAKYLGKENQINYFLTNDFNEKLLNDPKAILELYEKKNIILFFPVLVSVSKLFYGLLLIYPAYKEMVYYDPVKKESSSFLKPLSERLLFQTEVIEINSMNSGVYVLRFGYLLLNGRKNDINDKQLDAFKNRILQLIYKIGVTENEKGELGDFNFII